MPETTTAQDVIQRFCVSPAAKEELDRWKRDRPPVAEHVLEHVTRVPYRVDAATLQQVAESTEHALGEVKRKDAESVRPIVDWNPLFAFTHVLHYALETLGKPFTYEDFRSFCAEDTKAREMLWDPANVAIEETARAVGSLLAHAAMRWRIGNAYYSFLRELTILVELRERGLDLETHPLADALFRVDAWSGRTVVGLYIGNPKYRDGDAGRKKKTDVLLGPTFGYVPINMPTQHRFGALHVPTAEALDKAAAKIRSALDA